MILGIFTTIGIDKTIEARDNEGFNIFVESFGVSSTAGALDASRTTPNTEIYRGAVSSRLKINQNTIKIICTVPQAQAVGLTNINEIYLYGKDSSNVDFLLALGQPQNTIIYDPDGTVTLELQISLVNVNLTSLYQFPNTVATELGEHNTDPNAHPELMEELRHAGIKLDEGSFNTDYEGALYDKRALFDGDKATKLAGGVNFTATYTGTGGNSISLVFDGVKTVDAVRHAWNVANPDNTVEHDGAGTEVLTAQTVTLIGGSLNVSITAGAPSLVYKAADGIYKKALAGVSGVQAKPFGFAYVGERTVKPIGLHRYTHSFTIGANVYLSDSVAGTLTTTPTAVKVGYVHGLNTIALNLGVPNEGADDEYDAVVTDIAGVKNFPTTQAAINYVGASARILVNKLDELTATLTTTGKRIDFFFAGKRTGWKRYAGTNEQQLLTFSAVPTSGTWRIVYSGILETTDLPYNANAATVQAAINALFPSNLCTVTGNYSIGFTITHAQLADVPNPYFTDAGQNEIQHFAFSNTPDNGSFAVKRSAESSAALAYNDNATQFETYIEALSDVNDTTVSGSFGAGFTVEFTGVDGLQPQPQLTVATIPVNSLALGVSATTVTPTTTQQGKYPANALKNGINPLTITTNIISEGSAIGGTKAIVVDQPYTTFRGRGVIQNFTDGIDLNGQAGSDIDMVFVNTTNPILHTGLTPNRDYHSFNSSGLAERRLITVSSTGDYATLALAYAASNAGDKILVMEDQTITTAQNYSKEVEIEFLHNSKINVLTNIAGIVLILGAKVKTRNLKLFINHASSFTTGISLQGQQSHHEDLGFEVATGVTITNMIIIDSGCTKTYADGYLTVNAATVTNKVLDNATVKNNNYNFRDVAGLVIPPSGSLYGYDAVVGSAAQVAAGTATHSTLQAAHDGTASGACVLILRNATPYAGNLSITKNTHFVGQGFISQINGTVTFQNSCAQCSFKMVRFLQNVSIGSSSVGNIITEFWRAVGVTITDNAPSNSNLILGIGE